MCTLVVLRNIVPGWPLVLAANRDEWRERPWEAPRPDAEVLAPRDGRAGGTWLAVHRAGLVVALTNRPDPAEDPRRPSRGLLALAMARAGGVGPALALARDALRRERRNAFQVLVADAARAAVLVHPGPDGASSAETPVPRGLHHLTNFTGLDELDPRDAFRGLVGRPGEDLAAWLPRLGDALSAHADRGPGPPREICKHGERRGTLSAGIVALPPPGTGEPPRLLFAPGPPCITVFRPVDWLPPASPAG